ncbi:transposase [Streptomyces sp. ISL-96]|uniref:IS110 family transposase n=1 Tax=Streptomyces sp. ISL-96 TaxID=2819191 RepID=UPI0035ABAB3E
MGEAGTDTTTLGGVVPDTGKIAVYLGQDVGKGDHHGHGLTATGKTVHDKRLPSSEPGSGRYSTSSSPSSAAGWSPSTSPPPSAPCHLAVARDGGCEVACLPGLTMRRIADFYPGEQKPTPAAHPVPPQSRTRSRPAPGPPGRHAPAGETRLPGRFAQGRTPPTRELDTPPGPAHGRTPGQ